MMQCAVSKKIEQDITDQQKLQKQQKKQMLEHEKDVEIEAKIQKKLEGKQKLIDTRKQKVSDNVKSGFFIPYQPANVHTERG